MYQRVFVAGTFDELHKGHQAVLTRAFAKGERVTVGLTPDTFVKKLKPNSHVKSFDERKRTVELWIHGKGLAHRTAVIPIIDQYEPAASDSSLDALIVTPHNRATGEEINALREKRGLSTLTLIEVPLVPAQDDSPISSTRMRNGEIDAAGKLTMPETLRVELRKPLGRVLPSSEITADALARKRGRTIVTVGDVVTKTFLDAGVRPNLSIIDLRVARQQDLGLAEFASLAVHIPSGPGFISRQAIAAIGRWAETFALKGDALQESPSDAVIVIDGEEDLLVLPVLLAAPLESLVYYGQPPLRPAEPGFEGQAGQGMVEVEVTIEKKKEMAELLRRFEFNQ